MLLFNTTIENLQKIYFKAASSNFSFRVKNHGLAAEMETRLCKHASYQLVTKNTWYYHDRLKRNDFPRKKPIYQNIRSLVFVSIRYGFGGYLHRSLQ